MTQSDDREVRERIVWRGAESLSDSELLSVLIGESSKQSAIELANRVLSLSQGDLNGLSKRSVKELRSSGMGIRSAVTVAAAFELNRRLRSSQAEAMPVIHDKNDVVALLGEHLNDLEHEELWVLYLTSSGRLIEKRRVAQGGVSNLVVDNRLIVKRALELLCSSLIMVHNHPSGSANPSEQDKVITEQVRKAAELFDIALLDHIIIAREGAFSFFANSPSRREV